MAYGVIIQDSVMAMNVDSLNRSAECATAVENGYIVNLLTKSATAGEGELWTATQVVTAQLGACWMVYSPEIVLTGGKYKGLDPDPRNLEIPIGATFDVFKPMVGDLITMSDDAVAGTKSTNTYVVATNGAWQLTWAAAAISGLSLKLINTTSISIGLGTIASQKITAYQFEVVAVA